MATIQEMRTAITDVITSSIPELFTYPSIEAVVQVPCVIVGTPSANFAVQVQRGFQTAAMSMGINGMQEWTFELYVLVAIPDMGTAFAQLDSFINGTGEKSIREAIFNNDSLNDTVEDCMVLSMDQYGGNYAVASLPHIGARLTLRVLTAGS